MQDEQVGRGYDYDSHGHTYATHRQTDPHIAEVIRNALSDANTVLNVGAGTGSYEPEDRYVVAVEPSRVMRSQRIERGRAPAIDARAEALPFDDDAFEAATAFITLHHWTDQRRGIKELRRVARGPVLIMTFDPDCDGDFWLDEYFPEMLRRERRRYPSLEWIAETVGDRVRVIPITIPFFCRDGFLEAFYGRPEAFLDPTIRRDQSAWALVTEQMVKAGVERLREDLESGGWDRRYGFYRSMPFFEGALRLVVSEP